MFSMGFACGFTARYRQHAESWLSIEFIPEHRQLLPLSCPPLSHSSKRTDKLKSTVNVGLFCAEKC